MRQTRRSAGVLAWVVVGLGVVLVGVSLAFAQSDVLYVVNNKVGVGTDTPLYELEVYHSQNAATAHQVRNPYTGTDAAARFRLQNDVSSAVFRLNSSGASVRPRTFEIGNNDPAGQVLFFFAGGFNLALDSTGNVGIGTTSPVYPLHMKSGAYCSVGGTWVSVSSRDAKQEIQELSTETAEDTLEKLTPVTFAYKAEPGEHHVGFIAEDVPDLVATSDHKGMSPMDVVAVLTKVVQEQKSTLDRQQRLMEQQQRAIADLTAKVAEFEKQR